MTKLDEMDIVSALDKSQKQVVALQDENKALKLKVAELETKDYNFEAQVAKRMAEHGVYRDKQETAPAPKNLDEALEAYGKLTDADARAKYYDTVIKNLI